MGQFFCIITFFLIHLSCLGQDRWIKLYPNHGQLFARSIIVNDTIHSFGSDYINIPSTPVSVHISKSDLNGNLIFTDTMNFESIISASGLRFIIIDPGQVTYNKKESSFLLANTAIDTFGNTTKARIAILEYPKKKRLLPDRNVDTTINSINFLNYIEDKLYTIQLHLDQKLSKPVAEDGLYRYTIDSMHKLYSVKYVFTAIESRHIELRSFKSDRLDKKNILLLQSKLWNRNENRQDQIVKLDTLGNVLWTTHLTSSDSINTANTVYTQLANGDIVAYWNNYQYGAEQPQNPTKFINRAPYGTMAGVLIDYQTGTIKKRYDFFELVKEFSDKQYENYVGFFDNSISLNNKKIVPAEDGFAIIGNYSSGTRVYLENPDSTALITNKVMCFILKVNSQGNFEWYREIETFNTDSSSFGTEVFDAQSLPNDGFLISGMSQFLDGTTSGAYATLMKLDKYGCLRENCHTTDIIKLKKKTRLIIYPNPAQNQIILKLEQSSQIYQINLYDLQGKLQYKKLWEPKDRLTINTKKLKTGTYIIEAKSGKEKIYNKFQIIK